MRFLNLELPVRNLPPLDPNFVPMVALLEAHQAVSREPYAVALERADGQISVYETHISGLPELWETDVYCMERLVKFLLWSRGGYRLYLCGDAVLSAEIRAAYLPGGRREFDRDFMSRVYERPFEVVLLPYGQRPTPHETAQAVGGHLDGCRIGFDAGASDRKVSAVVNGECLYAEEVVWHPKTNPDPQYHFDGIVEALKTAASKLPRVDAVGISSAGVFVQGRCMVASLFLKVPQAEFDRHVKDIFLRAVRELGENIPVCVCNDGDVTALAGSLGLGDTGVLGISMGTSEAAGYVDCHGCVTDWLNELAFAPVDCQPDTLVDEWSGDIGCGVKYFSQDGVIRMAALAGLRLDGQTPAEKLESAQKLMENGNETARKIYESLGICLAHSLGLYSHFYEIKHVLILGRVMSGKGGDTLLAHCHRVLKEEYPHLTFTVGTPDEKTRRVGQSIAAASLPQLHK